MNAAISTSNRGAFSRSSACSTSGKLVVAPSRTAENVPINAFGAISGENAATSSTGNATIRARRRIVRGPMCARVATSTSAAAQAA